MVATEAYLAKLPEYRTRVDRLSKNYPGSTRFPNHSLEGSIRRHLHADILAWCLASRCLSKPHMQHLQAIEDPPQIANYQSLGLGTGKALGGCYQWPIELMSIELSLF